MSNDMMSGVGRCIALAALFGLVFFAAGQPARAERKGAELSILKSDGAQIRGELIALRGDTLILLVDGLDTSVDLEEISYITVVKKSRSLEGAGYGFLIGGGTGFIGGLAMGDDKPHVVHFTAGQKALLLGVALGAVGAITGLIAGAMAGGARMISMESRYTPEGKARILHKLNDLARVKSDTWVKK